MFLGKALLLGLAGGIVGSLAGSGLAAWLGPQLANVPVRPLPLLALTSTGVAVAVCLLASVLPAWRAARMDPCVCFREV
jgi:putative ABC transport system permease protein